MSSGFTLGDTQGAQGGRLSQRRFWVWMLALSLVGAAASLVLVLMAGDVQVIGDEASWRAVAAIGCSALVGLPGYAFFRLGKLSEGANWYERFWRPSALAGISLIVSVGSALYGGLLVASRLARDWAG